MLYSKYNQLLTRRPLLTNIITTGALFGTGDYLAQKISNGKFDSARLARAMVYGSIFFAPIGTKWYKTLPKFKFPGYNNSFLNTLTRVGVDQLVFAPIAIPTYYSVMTVLENPPNLLPTIKSKLNDNWLNTLQTNWLVWPVVQLVNFSLIPLRFQLLFVNLVSIGWNCYLSMALNSSSHLADSEDQILI
ncbi:hypothetical protein HYPBUDRAFT_114012 [Hyphopichia burtonii NRRL Y-1933]|uniref:Protein SYM1 n=1 Tax=Hyphopichia burtonii NRRL Y-1933 TaxID=984485 RepID=A0A1E4RDY1_9ASCO|nr:hypothetical protein HYPBUDRAFT_114012 [Hyphopichia burtonii NRRL Y-1933]ODV65451.1 hypothetical protein HYPBUDRAFT_114012 [Hyphopichia burtonii NRRL Y-1933]